ncbi:unnamed protein product [Prorocentrum cordatum]|uniref:Transmembrane 9 superfamily member n=1 Tax=Prorocentrum cordatum TaxID=2364126 RepID=A0ABN9WCS4_9DINO|nr:unnamed protein product [Polarella glacialis]
MFIHRTQGWSLMALGFCIQVLCCWWIPVMFFLSVVNFTTFCETRLRTWMVVFAVLILAIPLTIQCLNVSCAKLGYRFGYVVVSKCSWVAGAALLGYFMIYGLYLYENSTYVMCYDGTGLNPLAIMRALWILSFCFLTLLGIGMACICCSRGPRLEG